MTDNKRRVGARLSHDGEFVMLELVYPPCDKYPEERILGEVIMRPEQGYKLAQSISIKCIECEESQK